MLPVFTSKQSPRCFTNVLHDALRGNPDPQLVVVRPSGKDLWHLFEYSTTVDGASCQETVYLETLEDGCLDLPAHAPQGASRKNTPWQRPLQHRLRLSMEKDPSLSSPVDSPPPPLTIGVNMDREQHSLGYG